VEYEWVWNRFKARANRLTHGVDFVEAVRVFIDDFKTT
jgi:uncharacterized DUF497 family protein